MSDWYVSSSLSFESDKITIESPDYQEVMMSWEDSLMSASAAYVTQGGGDILEIGFGMGISAGYMHSHSIDSHTIVENHPEIIPKAVQWASNKSNVTIVSQSWYGVRNSLGIITLIIYQKRSFRWPKLYFHRQPTAVITLDNNLLGRMLEELFLQHHQPLVQR
jgi:hypothetical protein